MEITCNSKWDAAINKRLAQAQISTNEIKQRLIFKIAEYLYYHGRGTNQASAGLPLSYIVAGFEERLRDTSCAEIADLISMYKNLKPALDSNRAMMTITERCLPEKPVWVY